MNSTRTFVVVAALVALSTTAQAGLFGRLKGCGASKCCDCAPTCQPECCRPTICRPQHCNAYSYQRSCAKPFGCCDDSCCPNGGCCPADNGCCDNNACAPTTSCHTDGACCAPCDNGCAAPCDPCCETPCCDNGCCDTGCGHGGGLFKGLFGRLRCRHDDCCDVAICDDPCGADSCCSTGHSCKLGGLFGRLKDKFHGGCCDTGCCDTGCCDTGCCDDACCSTTDDCCELAELIYESQTACYPRQRRRALQKLSNRYSCACHPEVMCALIYALNDADPKVREEAADEIGDQLSDNPCCCSQAVVAALTCALGDCHRGTRKEAEKALEICGYDVIDCCNDCCDTGCTDGCTNGGHYAPSPNSGEEEMPLPASEEVGSAAPQQLPRATAKSFSIRNSLGDLFSMAH